MSIRRPTAACRRWSGAGESIRQPSGVHHDLGGHRPPIVVRRHDGAVRASVADREQVADFDGGQLAVGGERVARLADGPDDVRLDAAVRRVAADRLDARATRRTAPAG